MNLLDRVKMILLAPRSEWPAIGREAGKPSALFARYVAVLALIPALGRFIGASLVGGYAPIALSLIGALISYLASFAIVYILALVIDALAPAFGAQRNFARALKLAAYSCTPVWLAGIFLIVPGLSFLVVLGLQGAYLLWTGLPILMRAPAERALPYAAVVTGCALVVLIGVGAITAPFFKAPG